MLQKFQAVTTSTALTRTLESQFRPSPFDCPMAELFKLQQIGFVLDYYLKFTSLVNQSKGLNDETILNYFISGLHVDIKRDVLTLSPPTLLCAVALAKLYEDKYLPSQKVFVSSIGKFSHSALTNSLSTSISKLVPKIHVPNSKGMLPPLLPDPP